MKAAEILHPFERYTGKFERVTVEAAVARREEVTPELLRILEDTVDRAAELDAEGGYMAHLYAMFLLAQFRETGAYPLVVRFASLPGDLLDSLCGDFITEDIGQILASACSGELADIQSLIENEATDEWIRVAALSSLVTLGRLRPTRRRTPVPQSHRPPPDFRAAFVDGRRGCEQTDCKVANVA